MSNQGKIDIYTSCMYKYGIITLLRILEMKEREEDYLECAIIKQVIDKCSIDLNQNFPTKLPENWHKYIKDSASKYGMVGDVIIKNSDYYIQEILNEIKNLNP